MPEKRNIGENDILAIRAKTGDEQALLELWERNQGFIHRQINKRLTAYTTHVADREDLSQEAFIKLMEAVQTYDPEKSTFLTWYGYYLLSAFSDAQGKPDCGSLEEALSIDDKRTGLDLLQDDDAERQLETVEEEDRNRDLHDTLERIMDTFPENTAEIVKAHWYEEKPLSVVAAEHGLDYDETRKKANEGMKAFREYHNRKILERFFDELTPFYTGVGLWEFTRTNSSVVERLTIRRDELRKQYQNHNKRR